MAKTQSTPQNDLIEFAQKYSEIPLPVTGSDSLLTRDLPGIIHQYVKGGCVLDYGCGSGQSTLYLKSLGFKVEGVDVNPHMIEIARKQDPTGKYRVIKSGEIPSDDTQYDLVYVSWVLQFAKSKEELLKIFKEIRRVLKNEGTLIVLTNSNETFSYDWATIETNFEENKNLSSGCVVKFMFKKNDLALYCHFWTEDDYCEMLAKAGLTTERIHKPLGTESDGFAWINERDKVFGTVFVAKQL